MSALERVLLELESATAALATPIEDLHAARAAMERRTRAIAQLSRLAGALQELSAKEGEEVLRRLRAVSESGVRTGQWVAAVKSDVMAEWNQWSHIYRALGAASARKPSVVDYEC